MAAVVAGAVALLAAGVLAGSFLTGGGRDDTGGAVATAPPAVQEPATSAPTRTAGSAAPGPATASVRVAGQGFSRLRPEPGEDPEVSYAVVLANPTSDQVATEVRVLVAFTDRAGRPLATEDGEVDVLLPGQSGALAGQTEVIAAAARMRVQVAVVRWQPAGAATGRLTVDGARTSAAAGRVTTTGTLRSTFATDLADVQVVAVYRDGAGRILGGEQGDVDLVPAGGSVPVLIDTSSAPARIARTEMHATPNDAAALGG
jgi:hypothetical protein